MLQKQAGDSETPRHAITDVNSVAAARFATERDIARSQSGHVVVEAYKSLKKYNALGTLVTQKVFYLCCLTKVGTYVNLHRHLVNLNTYYLLLGRS